MSLNLKMIKLVFLVLNFIFFTGASVVAGTFYSYQTGSFQSISTWTTDPSGTTLIGSAIPTSSDNAVILNGRIVTMSANSVTVNSLTINSGGTLDLAATNSHNLGAVTGQGILKLKSSFFPAGVFTSFVSSSGGTIEFYDFGGAGTNLPTQLTYNNLVISNGTSSSHILNFQNTSNPTTYTVNGNFTVLNTGSGSLTINLGTTATNTINLSLSGNLTNSSGSTIQPGSFNILHTLSIHGDLTNSGTIHFTNNHPASPNYNLTSTTGAVTVTFSGSGNNTLTCNGITNFYNLYLDKGTDQTYELLVTSSSVSNFNIYGPNSQASPKALNIANGTLRLQGNITIPSLVEVSNTPVIPATGKLWIDGNNVSVTSSVGSSLGIDLFGTFKITAGIFNSNVATGFQCEPGSFVDVQGGTVNIANIRPKGVVSNPVSSYHQSGGVVNINSTGGSTNGGNAAFCYPYSTNSFTMSGGTINVLNPTLVTGGGQGASIAIGSSSSNYNVTGGTINVTIPGNQSFNTIITSSAPFYDLNINCALAGSNKTLIISSLTLTGPVTINAQPLTVLNDFTISGTNSPTFNSNGQNITVGGNLTIGTGVTYITGSNTTIFNKTSGTQSVALNNTSPTFNNLTINSGGTVSFSGNNPTVSGNLSITSGTLDDGGKTISVAGNVSNSGIHLSTASGSIALSGSGNQLISGNGSGVFGKLTVNNSGAAGSTAATLAANITITNSLSLTSNTVFDIGIYGITLLSSSTTAVSTTGSFSSQRMIKTSGSKSDAGLTMTYDAGTGDFVFPVGSSGKYTPITLNAATTGAYGKITVKPVNSAHPNVTAASQSLNYYWCVISSGWTGLVTAVHKNYTYATSDLQNPSANYVPARYDASSFSWFYGSTYNSTGGSGLTTIPNFNTGTGFASSTTSFIDGEYTAGNSSSFGSVTVYYSRQSGNWDTFSGGFFTTWSTVSNSGTASSSLPGTNSPVVIGDGAGTNHDVAIPGSAGSVQIGSLTLNSGSTLDLGNTTGHNFGALNAPINGNGTLRISSNAATAIFPSGDFTLFNGPSGGIVEYYDSGISFTLPAISASGSSLNSYFKLLLTPAAGRNITLANVNLTVYDNLVVNGNSNTARVRFPSTSQSTIVNGNINLNNSSLRFLSSGAQTVTVKGNISISSSAVLDLQVIASSTVHSLILHGNLSNDGQFILFTANGNSVCNLTLAGNSDASISGSGSVTTLNSLIVSKSSNQLSVAEINTPNFLLSATNSGTAKSVDLQSGTLKLTSYSSPLTLSSGANNGADFSINPNSCLWINGGTVRINATGTNAGLLLSGKIKMTAGAFNINALSSSDNYIEYSTSGTAAIDISGGTLTVGSQIRRSTSTTTGVLNLSVSGTGKLIVGNWQAPSGGRGVLEVLNSGSSFNMSGGTIEIVRQQTSPTTASLYLNPSTASVTGGVIQFGNASTPASQTISVNSSVPLYDVAISGTNSPIVILQVNGLSALNNLTINSGSTFTSNNLNVSVGGNLSNSGTYNPGTNTTFFNSQTTDQTITGNSVFYNLTINNTKSNGSVVLQPSTAITVNNDLSISSGIFADGGNVITVAGNVSNSSVHSSTGSGKIRLFNNNTVSQLLNGTGIYGNLDVDNTQGVTLSADQTVNGTLTFTNGLVNLGVHSLVLGSSSVLSGFTSSKYITTSGALSDGGITKSFPSGTFNFTFPVGVSGKYTPAQYISTSNTASGTITVKPANFQHPSTNQIPALKSLKYYWNVVSTGFSGLSVKHFYSYNSGDVQGTEASYISGYLVSSVWTTGTINAGSVSSQIIAIDGGTANSNNGVNFIGGDFTTGEPTEFPAILTYTSNVTTGNWETAGTWDLNQIPASGSNVIIRSGDAITVTANSKQMNSLTINSNSILDLGTTTSHNFGLVAGTGKIKIASSIFPGGNYSSFTSAGNGTVEYNSSSAQNLPIQTTYNNIVFSGNSLKTIGNIDLTINGDLTITAGSLQQSSSFPSKTITLSGNWTNNGSLSFSPQSGTVILSGTNAQTISGTVSGETFYNMTVNKSAQKINLSLNATVSNNLNLTGGIISTGSSIMKLTKSNSNPVSGFSASSYIDGILEIAYPSSGSGISRTFPVGTSSVYKAITISGTPSSAVIRSQLANSSPTHGGLGGGLQSLSFIRYFPVDVVSGVLNNALISLPVGSDDAVSNSSTLVVANSTDNSNWLNSGQSSFAGTITNGSITSANIFSLTGQNYFTFGSVAMDNSLPVELDKSSVEIEWENGKVIFSFATESELNVALWELQRQSGDDQQWVSVFRKKSDGNSSSRKEYSLFDLTPVNKSQYRLIEYDQDGTSETFGPYAFAREIPERISLYPNYPNPFNPETTISFENAEKELIAISIYNIQGQLVRELENREFPGGYHSISWNGKNSNGLSVSSGVYLLQLKAGKSVKYFKMLMIK